MNFKDKSKLILIGTAVIIAIVVIVGGISYKNTIDRPLKIKGNEEFIVNEGDSFNSVLTSLSNENKIKSPLIIKVYTKLTGINLEILPGQYVINSDMSLKELINTLSTESNLNAVDFTVPEGFTINDIAEKLENEGLCTSEAFINAVKEYPLPDYVKADENKRYNLEGFLFPDTYKFDKGIEANEIVATMLLRFEEVWDKVTKELEIDIKTEDIENVINVAAMIEKEARVEEDRPLIASVIYNRLDIDMPLQICATVIYAHGYNIEDIREGHLAIESDYNTYIHYGLPVGPISNPGIASIIAALQPAKTDYLFYLLDQEDKHYFTNNYEDFEKRKEELGY